MKIAEENARKEAEEAQLKRLNEGRFGDYPKYARRTRGQRGKRVQLLLKFTGADNGFNCVLLGNSGCTGVTLSF